MRSCSSPKADTDLTPKQRFEQLPSFSSFAATQNWNCTLIKCSLFGVLLRLTLFQSLKQSSSIPWSWEGANQEGKSERKGCDQISNIRGATNTAESSTGSKIKFQTLATLKEFENLCLHVLKSVLIIFKNPAQLPLYLQLKWLSLGMDFLSVPSQAASFCSLCQTVIWRLSEKSHF